MKPYQFSYLRYIHDVSTEEFVNIGIVMFIPNERRFLYLLTEHYARLSEFYLDFQSNNYKYLLRSLKARLKSAEDFDFPKVDNINKILLKIVPIESGCFQWSDTMSGVVEQPEKRLEKLFAKVITAHETRKTRKRRDEKDIAKNLSNLLQQKGLLSDIESNVTIHNRDLNYSYEFKFGWQNGKKQFAEPISLDYKNKKDLVNKVSNFIGDMFSLKDSEDFQVTPIVAPPKQDNLKEEYENAIVRMKEIPQINKIISEDQIKDFILKIETDISSHRLQY